MFVGKIELKDKLVVVPFFLKAVVNFLHNLFFYELFEDPLYSHQTSRVLLLIAFKANSKHPVILSLNIQHLSLDDEDSF